MTNIELQDCEKMSSQYPESFLIPPAEACAHLPVGSFAKLIFLHDGTGKAGSPRREPLVPSPGERMWVRVTDVTPTGYRGTLDSTPVYVSLAHGDPVEFEACHVASVLFLERAAS